MLVCVPATEAQVQATHECNLTIDQAKLLVMSPVQNDIIAHSVQSLQCVL